MHNLLIPALLVVVLPALYFAVRLRLLERRAFLWAATAAAALVLACNLPYAGIDQVYIKRISLVLATATALLMLARHLRAGPVMEGANYTTALVLLASLALVNYLNFFSFHGQRTFIHAHDAAHYYLGSKYFEELEYAGLYTAMVRAEAEAGNDRLQALEVRDLATNDLVHVRELLAKSEPIKASFTPERWYDFKKDSAFFRQALGPHYGKFLRDHGFNPTPVWALIGGALANLVPAGSHAGILLLCLLDPVLLIAAFAILWRTFGRDAALLCLTLFCTIYGATFGWTGGAFLRYPWFCALVAAICCLQRDKPATAGALIAFSSMLRIFPAAFAAGIAFQALGHWHRTRQLPAFHRRFLVAFGAAAMAAFLSTSLLPEGITHWSSFQNNIRAHHANVAPNLVGLTQILAQREGPELVTHQEFQEIKERRSGIHTAQLATILPLALILLAALSQRQRATEAAVAGIILLPVALNLAAYYYAVLTLLLVVNLERPGRIALIFAVEAATYALLLFEDAEGPVHVYRSALVLYLLGALYLDPIRGLLGRTEAAGQPPVR